ncbi:MAG: cytochrome c oxidase subunit I [Thiomicrorhabdus sp.]|nr:MAG: cytochrome c oxidase subunit I [Thiomicrorhabdus sp.]
MKFDELNKTAAKPWLVFASSALGISALLAILLVLSRVPGVQDYFGLQALFHTILVLHVNFSVLVWLLSFVGFIWVLHKPIQLNKSNRLILLTSFVGSLLMLISPFISDDIPVMSNYIPVIDSPVFFSGLLLFALGISWLALQVLWSDSGDLIRLSALVWIVCLIVLVYHGVKLNSLDSTMHFEALFWGAGHVLQFVYVLILWLVWQWPNVSVSKLGKISIVAVLLCALGFMLFFEPGESDSRLAFTSLMKWGMLIIILPMLWHWFHQLKLVVDASVSASAFLMCFGLAIGLIINDDTVIVTAHYHATNAAITIAFMGFSYRFLNKMGQQIVSAKWMTTQVFLYTFGMILYVLGMASSGWLGVPRKTAVTVDDRLEILSMGLMGVGGAISIVATLIFIAIIAYSFIGQQKLSREFK